MKDKTKNFQITYRYYSETGPVNVRTFAATEKEALKVAENLEMNGEYDYITIQNLNEGVDYE